MSILNPEEEEMTNNDILNPEEAVTANNLVVGEDYHIQMVGGYANNIHHRNKNTAIGREFIRTLYFSEVLEVQGRRVMFSGLHGDCFNDRDIFVEFKEVVPPSGILESECGICKYQFFPAVVRGCEGYEFYRINQEEKKLAPQNPQAVHVMAGEKPHMTSFTGGKKRRRKRKTRRKTRRKSRKMRKKHTKKKSRKKRGGMEAALGNTMELGEPEGEKAGEETDEHTHWSAWKSMDYLKKPDEPWVLSIYNKEDDWFFRRGDGGWETKILWKQANPIQVRFASTATGRVDYNTSMIHTTALQLHHEGWRIYNNEDGTWADGGLVVSPEEGGGMKKRKKKTRKKRHRRSRKRRR